MAFYGALLCSIALFAIVTSVLTKFKLVSRNGDNRETTERQQRLKRDRKADLGHKIGLGELNYWREYCQMQRTFLTNRERYIMIITKTSPLTGMLNTMDIDVTPLQIEQWERGMLIQEAMPLLTIDEREFIMTGLTSSDWENML